MGVKVYSKGFHLWSPQADRLDITKVIEMYEGGFAGAFQEPEERERFVSQLPVASGMAVATQYGLTETGKGKLSLPYIFADRHWPQCWPSPAQETGSCVSKAGKNCAIVLIGVECEIAAPDPVTGKIEGWPEVSALAEKNGVIASEPLYGHRGHGGQGASCGRLQGYVTTNGGVIVRKNYADLGINLEEADDMLGAKWGGRGGTPEGLNVIGREHQIRTATECEDNEVCRDFVANGYPIWACSSLGWSKVRDENGYSKRSGSWSHSWIVAGYDDRPVTVQEYGFPLFLYMHDWGKWNSGGRRVLGTDIDIPEGCFWGDARLLDSCECTAMSSLNGWPRRQLPDWGGSLAG